MSVRRRPTVAVALSALLLLTGCGGSGSDAEPEDTASASAPSSGEPDDEPTAGPTDEPTTGPTEEPTEVASPLPSLVVPSVVPSASAAPTGPALEATECKEAKLDTDGVEMVAVKLTKVGEVITMTVTLDQPVPKNRDILWSIWANRSDGADGPKVVQLGAEISDGDKIAHFVFAGGAQTNLSGTFKVAGKKVTAEFPASAITPLGAGASWYATETVEHETKDYCPGGRGTQAKDVDAIDFPASWF